MLKNDKTINRKDVERTFKMLKDSESETIKIKMANLFLLECFLIPKQNYTLLNLKHLDILDNDQLFK